MPSTEAEVHVAVGVLHDAQGRILLTRRHRDSHQGGLWEFPGGKVEGGESLGEALRRELLEELGVTVLSHSAFLEVCHDYGDKRVRLEIHEVSDYRGDPIPRERQPMRWVSVSALHRYEFPAANRPIVDALTERAARQRRE